MSTSPQPVALADARIQQITPAQARVSDNSPLYAVPQPSVPANKFWLVTQISALAVLVNAPTPNPCWGPLVGFFLVPTAQAGETLAQAQKSLPTDPRLIPLDTRVQLFTDSSGQNTMSMVWRGVQIAVPTGYTIIGIIDVNPGNAAPGPGAGSWMVMTVIGSMEDQTGC